MEEVLLRAPQKRAQEQQVELELNLQILDRWAPCKQDRVVCSIRNCFLAFAQTFNQIIILF